MNWTIFWIVLAVIAAILVGLYFWGRKLQAKYDSQQELINQNKQAATLFVIDKKKDKVDNLKLPKQVKDSLPKLYRKRKMPVVIAKIGPQIQTLMCDERIYNSIPTKKQIKVELAGILIVNVLSGKLPEAKKKGIFAKAKDKVTSMTASKK
ncbi:hypothetical protein CS063_13620 [Sporanaerobium hydrogeniformans]|uniref:Uncharacterized protein n=1 Tax=Sporanaerobium hydrogeniformans TaxID=3072179 RepID=A0AC61DBC0_9FIRM|nr:hypothetical protein [Sporanaerobium hydrogeniformans]PHV69872.1 hypothetical protein CS063_13620 [Sporanaerobium hydrogeniformans]